MFQLRKLKYTEFNYNYGTQQELSYCEIGI